MNVFATDHPMVSEASPALLRFQKRLLRGLLIVLLAYPLYLALLGPLWALDGRGTLDFVPDDIERDRGI